MGVDEKSIIQVMSEAQFIIPVYQRHYTWNEEQCIKLWDDLTDALDSGEDDYFLGSLVVYEDNNEDKSSDKIMNVVDGQQRLTSLLLMMKVLHELDRTAAAGLKNLIYVVDSATQQKKEGEYRITSNVISPDGTDDKNMLINVLNSDLSAIAKYDSKKGNKF